jgi:hypothetical protein
VLHISFEGKVSTRAAGSIVLDKREVGFSSENNLQKNEKQEDLLTGIVEGVDEARKRWPMS